MLVAAEFSGWTETLNGKGGDGEGYTNASKDVFSSLIFLLLSFVGNVGSVLGLSTELASMKTSSLVFFLQSFN